MQLWIFLAIASAFFYTIFRLVEKKILFHEHSKEYSCVRALTTTFFALIFLSVFIKRMSLQDVMIVYIISIFFTFLLLLRNKSTRHLEISFLSPFLSFEPLIVVILAFFFLGEILEIYHIMGIILIITGAYFIQLNTHNIKKHYLDPIKTIKKSKYLTYLLISVIGYAILRIIQRYVFLNITNPINYLLLIWIFTSINLIFVMMFKLDGVKSIVHGYKNAGFLIIWVAIFGVLADVTQYLSLSFSDTKVSLAISLLYLQILFQTFLGGKLFHEHNLDKRILSAIVMIVGAILVSI